MVVSAPKAGTSCDKRSQKAEKEILNSEFLLESKSVQIIQMLKSCKAKVILLFC